MTAPRISRSAYLTSGEVAERFGVSIRSVQLWVNSGMVPSARTPGGHRRIHTAHAALLLARLKTGQPHPNAAEFEAAELAWTANPDTLPSSAQQQRRADFAVSALNANWLIQKHNIEREKVGSPVMARDSHGFLSRIEDVTVHAAWCQGLYFALEFLTKE
jgi:excisionase family DNA binding protein